VESLPIATRTCPAERGVARIFSASTGGSSIVTGTMRTVVGSSRNDVISRPTKQSNVRTLPQNVGKLNKTAKIFFFNQSMPS